LGEEDLRLVRLARSGADPEAAEAFAALYDRWSGPVYRFVRRRIRSDADAEDAVAETFLEAWKSLGTLQDPSVFRAWLYRIAWTRVVRIYEARGMRTALTLVEQSILDERTAEAPAAIREDLREALKSLPEEDLRILLDRYETSLTYKEIADRDGISVSTVRDRIVAARARLTRVLQRAGLLEEFAREMEARRSARRNGGSTPPAAPPSHG
jgi:RNA polymerase sigma-70 factor (ECF subfamily)